MLTKLFLKIARPLGLRALTRWVRDVAEGDHGEGLQKVYWKLAGGKRWIAFGLGVLATAAVLLGLDPRVGFGITAAATFLFSVGLTDNAWRETWRPDWLTESIVYRILAAAPVEVAGAFTGAYAWTAASCTWPDPWCAVTQVAVLFGAAIAIQCGLLDAAWRAPIPQVSQRRIEEIKAEPWLKKAA